jgi:hypothetical protein
MILEVVQPIVKAHPAPLQRVKKKGGLCIQGPSATVGHEMKRGRATFWGGSAVDFLF